MATKRQFLIQQLRTALHILESPKEDVVEFTIDDTDFSYDKIVLEGSNRKHYSSNKKWTDEASKRGYSVVLSTVTEEEEAISPEGVLKGYWDAKETRGWLE